ncbi:hypothetical protein KSP35_00435 [Aquihabitans sp. G128]|uniref:hypothetical protein n=1 Tax=Aquihabitans sp. G128 TaxID=2849779 RepID=UPI001C22ACAE|nr:hypothetical protein [Aquihabitans sp. G128]QXC61359.1 hypothetical protein KSP35_00435 [Aquihabitans sp. G128]
MREARTDNVAGTEFYGSFFCLGARSRPAGFIRASGLLARGSDWCVADAAKYSTSTTDTVIRGVGFHGSDLPCGDGNYSYTSLSEVMNGGWNGGNLTTGSLYMWK